MCGGWKKLAVSVFGQADAKLVRFHAAAEFVSPQINSNKNNELEERRGAQGRNHKIQRKQSVRKKVGQFLPIGLYSFFRNCPTADSGP
jgi:hypothetical protein